MASIFSRIVAGEIPAHKVYEDDKVLAFLDITPDSKGHTLVIPKEEYKDILELPDELASHIIITAKKIAIAIKAAFKPDGFNFIQNNGSAAGQIIFHYHLHIIPRYADKKKDSNKKDFEKIAEAIKVEIKP